MKPKKIYLLFGGDWYDYDREGGWCDLKGDFDTFKECRQEAERLGFNWAHVVNTQTWKRRRLEVHRKPQKIDPNSYKWTVRQDEYCVPLTSKGVDMAIALSSDPITTIREFGGLDEIRKKK